MTTPVEQHMLPQPAPTATPEPPQPAAAATPAPADAKDTPQLPPGVTYATLFPRIDFPELSPPGGETVWVEIRNPGMMPPAALEQARANLKDIPTDDQGRPLDEDAAAPAVFAMLAKMIRRWHVYDIMADDDPLPLLPSPPRTADVVMQAPSLILQRVMALVEQLQVPR